MTPARNARSAQCNHIDFDERKMNSIPKAICIGLAAAVLGAASMPARSWTLWPDVDFEWYLDAGRPTDPEAQPFPAPREGYIWSPAHYERTDSGKEWVAGKWIRDDYAQQVAAYAAQPQVSAETSNTASRERQPL
jgi:hypothetical protein